MSLPAPLMATIRGTLSGQRAWLVGGTVRDRLLERPPPAQLVDIDLVVEHDAQSAARLLGEAAGGTPFALSEQFGAWRVVGGHRAWQLDISPLAGTTIEQDLAARDFTINAIAESLDDGTLVDPFGGRDDLAAKRLRMVGEDALRADPLRVARLARLVCELGFEIEPQTLRAAQAHVAGLERVAAERIFAELRRIIVAPGVMTGLEAFERVGAMAVVLPEVTALHGVQQNRFHHRDVHGHTLETVAAVLVIEQAPAATLGHDATAVAAAMTEPLAEGFNRWQALRLGALLHDVAKPLTSRERPGGGFGFPDHDVKGATLARSIMGRLRSSERLRTHVAALVRHHLRLGFLVRERPLSRRAIYCYLRDCEPVEIDVTVLSVADRLATRGEDSEQSIERHLRIAGELLSEALRWPLESTRPPLVRGDELARELDVPPGPALGRMLDEIAQARFAGEISTHSDALDLAWRMLEADEDRDQEDEWA